MPDAPPDDPLPDSGVDEDGCTRGARPQLGGDEVAALVSAAEAQMRAQNAAELARCADNRVHTAITSESSRFQDRASATNAG